MLQNNLKDTQEEEPRKEKKNQVRFVSLYEETTLDDQARETSLNARGKKALVSESRSIQRTSPKHMHRSHCERNFTGYIDKREGLQVGQPENREKRMEKKRE